MPNPERGRGDARREPHARPGAGSPDRRWPSRNVAAAALVLIVFALGVATAVAGFLGGAGTPVAAVVSDSPVASLALTATASPPASAATDPSSAATASAPPASAPPSDSPAPSASPTPLAGVPATKLQRALDAFRAKTSIPGVSVAILWNDGRTWLGTSGYADVAAKRKLTPDDGFALASISKTFTAGVVLQLVGEGKLHLDDRVAPLLPQFKLDPRITVRMLLDHTSGLPDFFLNPKINHPLQAAKGATWTPQRTFRYVLPAGVAPGKLWRYSNTNYLLLGELVEEVTGNPLATEIRTRLLDPLGLDQAWYQAVEQPKTPLTVGYRLVASGGRVQALPVAKPSTIMPFRSVVTAAAGAGSIAATAQDTARWMRAFASGQVLDANTQHLMLADAALTKALKARITYGLGIQVVTLDGHRALGHSGRYLGYRNVVRYLPNDGLTIAVLTNQGSVDPARIAATLLKIVLPPAPKPAP